MECDKCGHEIVDENDSCFFDNDVRVCQECHMHEEEEQGTIDEESG